MVGAVEPVDDVLEAGDGGAVGEGVGDEGAGAEVGAFGVERRGEGGGGVVETGFVAGFVWDGEEDC